MILIGNRQKVSFAKDHDPYKIKMSICKKAVFQNSDSSTLDAVVIILRVL